MRYLFFIFIILLQFIDVTSAQAMRRGVGADNASTNASRRLPGSEGYEMVQMSQSLPIGSFHFGGRENNSSVEVPNSSQKPPTQRRESGLPYKTSGEWTIQSPASRKSPSVVRNRGFFDDEDGSSLSDDESILLMEEVAKDDLPISAEDWGMKVPQKILRTDKGEFVVGSPHLAPKVNGKGL